MVDTITYPTAPTVQAINGTLLDVTGPPQGNSFVWQDGLDLFESFSQMKFQANPEFCAPGALDFGEVSTWVNGYRFVAQGGYSCSTIGTDRAQDENEVAATFDRGEHIAVEKAMLSALLQEGPAYPGGTDPQWAAPVDITPAGGAVSPVVGMALLEGFSASEYIGRPVLHMPRTIASILGARDAISLDGNMLVTDLGSKVAAGGGYDYPNTGPTGAAAAAGEKWIYATGQVVVLAPERVVNQQIDYTNNRVLVLAQRPYIIAAEPFRAAVRVKIEV